MADVFGFLRSREKLDETAQDALYQYNKGMWNDRIKEKDKAIKLAWSCCGGMFVIAVSAVVGCIYLGTLPKSSVEWGMLDPLGYSMKTYKSDILTGSEINSVHVLLVEKFIKSYRETHPVDKKGQQAALVEAAKMTSPGTPAWKKGTEYFEQTKPYERMKKELVSIDKMETNLIADNTWHVQFDETVMNLTSHASDTRTYAGTVVTEQRKDGESQKQAPLGLFVVDFNFDEKERVK
jgi:type IV secretory pathway TrbF-like protein